jgi:hypothetical protein
MLLQRALQGHIGGDVETTKGVLFDGRTASNIGMVATGIPKNDHHHRPRRLRHDEESSHPARQPWRGL